MNVFARFFSDNGLDFRTNTILQFGDSWEIVGAAFLINPGSAEPTGDVTDEELAHLEQITQEKRNWKRSSADPTMNQLEKIFNGWYLGNPKPLNGVILLFNLFNLRNKNLQQALESQSACKSPLMFSTEADIQSASRASRIYLGWGKTGKNQLRAHAGRIFEALKSKVADYTTPDFTSNAFYHPGYVNRSYNRNTTTQQILNKFLSVKTS